MRNTTFRQMVAWMLMLTLNLTQLAQTAQASLVLANTPLASTTASTVRPNLMYVLDDSGSMGWDYTPDYINDSTTAADPGSQGGTVGDGATAHISSGAVTQICSAGQSGATCNSGWGTAYVIGAPSVVILGRGSGGGATATANLDPSTKRITSITITNGGSGYLVAPSVLLVGGMSNATWGMCWGTTANNSGGSPRDTIASPTCTTPTMLPYATSAINYQYYDPAVRYEVPRRAAWNSSCVDGDNTCYYPAATPTAAPGNGFSGSSSTKNLTTTWTHEVWCNSSTASPSAGDPTAAGRCRENADTSNNTLYPNATYTYRKTYSGGPFYYRMSPAFYCRTDEALDCRTSAEVVANGSTSFSGISYNVPINYRWCAYYDSYSKTFGNCQANRDLSHYIPSYLGGWVSSGASGTAATASLTVTSVDVNDRIDSLAVDGIPLTGSVVAATNSTSDFALAICTAIRATADATGYTCATTGNQVTVQSLVYGDLSPAPVLTVSIPSNAAVYSAGTLTVSSAGWVAGAQILSITVGSNELLSSIVTASGSYEITAGQICDAINSGPNQALYVARAPASAADGDCTPTNAGELVIKRKLADDVDDGAAITVTQASGSVGTLTINSTGGPTRIASGTGNALKLNGAALLAADLSFADGTQTNAIASTVHGAIQAQLPGGCTTSLNGNRITFGGTCAGALANTSTGTQSTGVFRVSPIGSAGDDGSLGGVQVGTTDIVGVVSAATLTDTTAAAANAASLTTLINNATAAASGGVGPHNFSAAAPVANGANYDITVTAPSGNSYNGYSFSFLNGTTSSGTTGTAPSWTFRISNATADSALINSIQCGATHMITQNTASTGAGSALNYLINLAADMNGEGDNGYSHSCTVPTSGSPISHCTVTRAGAPNCSSFDSPNVDAGITMTTPTRTQSGGSAVAPTWTFDVTSATSDNATVSGISCGGTQLLGTSASTGATSSYASVLAANLNSQSSSQFGWNGTSGCSATGDSVSCSFQRDSGAGNRCAGNAAVVTTPGGQTMSVGAVSESWNGTRYSYSFTISNVTQPNETVTQVACANSSSQQAMSSTATRQSGDGTSDFASRINSASASQNGWNGDSNCSRVADGHINCQFERNSGSSNRCSSVTTAGSGVTFSSVTESWNGTRYIYEFDITNAGNTGDAVSSVICISTAPSMPSSASTGSSSASDRIRALVENNGSNDLESAINQGGYAASCTTPTVGTPQSTCTVTGPAGAAACATLSFTNDPSISIANQVRTNAGSNSSNSVWEYDITGATAANAEINRLRCNGTATFDEDSNPDPSTGTSSGVAAWQRINNLTQGGSGLNSLGSNGYSFSCSTASASTTYSDCTVTGPIGATACASSPYLSFSKAASITIGTPTQTSAGSSAGVAVINFQPALSTVSPFTVAHAAQGTSQVGMATLTPTPITVGNGGVISNGATANTDAATITPLNTTLTGGSDASTATNYWTGVGRLQRVDVIPANLNYDRASGRTDCAGSTCTYTEELQNFANWYTYYRTRMQMMKSATTRAFSSLDGNYRIGFDNICQATGSTVDNRISQFVDSGGEIANHRTSWWTSLTGATPSCATPLRTETAKIGRYFAGKLASSGDPIQYSCQQNFMILVTDGYWNESDPAGTSVLAGDIGNVDNNLATAPRPYYDGAQFATACPNTGSTRSTASSCRTLSDIAWYYYSTDLRSSAFGNTSNGATDVSTNNVLTSDDDKNTAQHMNFYAMGLGIDGSLRFRSDYQTATSGSYAEILAGTANWPAVRNLDPTGVDDLWHATVNGHGKYFSARNVPNVITGLQETLNKIGSRVGSAAAAATSNLEPVAGDNFAYVASYATVDWTGDLQSRSIDVTTGDVSPDTNCTTAGSGCQWSAQQKIDNMTWSARRIYLQPSSVTSGDPLRAFAWDNLSGGEAALLNPSTLSQYGALSVSNPLDITAEKLSEYLRGSRALEMDGNIIHAQVWRKRQHVLGDIVNTQPVFSKAPNRLYTDAGYDDFKTTSGAATRAPVVYISSQDGMLHAINAHTSSVTVGSASVAPGEELWAYIPQESLTGMKALADTNYAVNHRYFIDGPITVADVNFGNGDSDWHTILVAGMGSGGKTYFALDVTDPTAPTFLWEITSATAGFSDLGYTFANPAASKLPNGEWAVLFSSGYNNADGYGYLYAVDPKTGAMKTDFPLSTSSGSGVEPSNLGKIAIWVDNPATDNTAQYVYAGDMSGDLWRFDLAPSAAGHSGVAVFKLAHLSDADGLAQPITTKPEISQAPHTTDRLVFVGTGRYLQSAAPSDLTNTDVQSFYGIKDSNGAINLGGASEETWNPRTDTLPSDATKPMFLQRKLISTKEDGNPITVVSGGETRNYRMVCAGAASTVTAAGACANEDATELDWAVHGGWFVDFPESGERMNVDMKLTKGTLVFATNIPGASSCTVGGTAWGNFLDFATGLEVDNQLASIQISDSLVVGITVVRLQSGEYKAIATKSNYQQETLTVPVNDSSDPSGGTFQSKRSLWREFEAY